MKPLIFLDCDGVLNCLECFRDIGGLRPMGAHHVRVLRAITEITGAEIVVSSTWRLSWSVRDMIVALECQGFPRAPVISRTPNLPGEKRGIEIQKWITDNGQLDRPILILDDDVDMGHLREFLVKTDSQRGLLIEHLTRAVKMLTGDS